MFFSNSFNQCFVLFRCFPDTTKSSRYSITIFCPQLTPITNCSSHVSRSINHAPLTRRPATTRCRPLVISTTEKCVFVARTAHRRSLGGKGNKIRVTLPVAVPESDSVLRLWAQITNELFERGMAVFCHIFGCICFFFTFLLGLVKQQYFTPRHSSAIGRCQKQLNPPATIVTLVWTEDIQSKWRIFCWRS